jgi:predicted MPP superfamily phosphohydrolase
MKRIRALASNGNEPVRIATMVAIWIGLHLYAGRPLIAAARAGGIAPLVAYALLVALSAVSVLPFFAKRTDPLRRRSAAHWIGYATMSLFATLLVLVLLADVVRLSYAALSAIVSAQTWPLLNIARLNTALLGGAIVLFLVGLLQARRPAIRSLAVPIADLPAELDGYRIVQWSDVHVGPTIQRGFVASLVERTNALDADAIVITGDLIDGYVDDLRDEVQPLRELRARDGVFYVTGNHEYYWRASEWMRELVALGLTFLKNEHHVIRRGDARLVIAGVTDPAGRYTHKTNPAAAMSGAPADAVSIMLAHRPQNAAAASRLGVDLQLSGHTHGGQFFPFNLAIRWFQPVVTGLHRVGATWLYVSRGTGYWGPPSRLGVGGEITVIELRRAQV